VEIIHIAVFKKNDARTIYNVCYKDGESGITYIKRFNVPAVTRDREYDVTMGTPKSRVTWFSANANGEAEIIKITLKPHEKIKKLVFEKDFSEVAIKGRSSRGNLVTKNDIFRIQLKAHGGSTLGGRQVWWDSDVQRINYDEHGVLLGEFHNEDSILVVLPNGDFYLTNFDTNNHYEQNILRIEKFNSKKVWTAVLWDADNQNMPYIKRFHMEATAKKQNFLGENPDSKLILLTDTYYPRLRVDYNDPNIDRPSEEVDAEQFIAVKGFRAKGKRLTTFPLDGVVELEPLRQPAEEDTDDDESEELSEVVDPDEGKSDSDIRDEITGQLKLF
jgi:topoisomerase-4 subunit A